MSTVAETELALQMAIEHAVEEYRRTVRVTPATLPHDAIYGFNPEGWSVFAVGVGQARGVGASEYVAVNVKTGETKSLGEWGE